MDEQPPRPDDELARLEALAREQEYLAREYRARKREILDQASEAAFARVGRPSPTKTRRGPTPPPGLLEGLDVANRLRPGGPERRTMDDVCSATLAAWADLNHTPTPLPHDPACEGGEPSFTDPYGERRHATSACPRRVSTWLSPVVRTLTLGETLAIGVLIRGDQQPDFPLSDDAVMVLETLPALDLGRLAGLGAALAACWAARRADPAARLGTWVSRIRRCVLPRPEWARPDPTCPTYVPVPTCGRFLLDTSQVWRDPLRRRLACREHAVPATRGQGGARRTGVREVWGCSDRPQQRSAHPAAPLPRSSPRQADPPQCGA